MEQNKGVIFIIYLDKWFLNSEINTTKKIYDLPNKIIDIDFQGVLCAIYLDIRKTRGLYQYTNILYISSTYVQLTFNLIST